MFQIRGRIPTGRQRQPTQLEREQLPQFDPPPPEPPLARPVVAKVEKILWHFFAPHSWQEGSPSPPERTRTSKRAPQESQSYSIMGTSASASNGDTTPEAPRSQPVRERTTAAARSRRVPTALVREDKGWSG